jgi:ribosomal protein L21E
MPGLSFYDKQHIQKVAAQQAVIANIFNQFILSVSPYLRKWSDAGKNNVWISNQGIESAVDRELLNLESMLYANISAFQKDGWERAERKNDDFISLFIKGMSISSATKDGMFTHSLSAFEALKNDIDSNGLKLSDRVWNITQQTKSQLEFYLDSGVVAGRNSNGISSDIRQILQNPQKRFRRIRNEKGELVLSQPMKDYHPGQGVYRSAYKNALRTSATTTNTAYRSADYERWSKQDFILGIEIQRSANNRGPCKICDAMVGKYPKTFKFTGFHPFCICFATPITMEPENFADFLLNDTVPKEQVITDIPQGAKDFVSENKDGLQSAFWYKDNFTNDGGLQREIVSQPITNEVIKVSKPKRIKTDAEITDIKQKWNERKLYNKITNTENEIRLNKSFETGVLFDKNGNVVIDKRGAKYSVEFTDEECAKMKDCIFTHNHPRGWQEPEKSLGRIGNSFSPADMYLAIAHNVSEMRAVTPNYTFAMKRPEEGWGITISKFEKLVNRENNKLRAEFTARINNNTLSPTMASVVHYHILWKRISEKMGWNYTKAKTR